jgi:peroxiredoxin
MASFLAIPLLSPRRADRGNRKDDMRSDIAPGAVFPDYELSDHNAKRRRLSELQGQDPLVLVLGRGGYCPKDRRQPEGLVELHREIAVAYCRLVTITTDNIIQTNEYRSGVGAHWPSLADAGRVVQKDLDIAEPVLRTAWQEGRKELFYPYGKTYLQTLVEHD